MNALRRWVASNAFANTITVIIVINAVVLGMQTSDELVQRWGSTLNAIDRIALAIFTVEILLKATLLPRRSVRSGWFWFDLSVVAVSYVPDGGSLSVLRALRLFRVMRLVSVVPSLRKTVSGLLGALPGMGSVVALLALVFYVAGVMATELFGAAFPQWFGTLGRSLYSLFQIMTLESWSNGIVRPILKEFPYAWAFFIPFIVVTSFAVLNMFIGVIVSSIEEDAEEDRQLRMAELEQRLEERFDELAALIQGQQDAPAAADTPPPAPPPETPRS